MSSGWPLVPLTDACTLITDGTHHSPRNGSTGDFKYVTAKNIRKWGLDLSDITYVDAATHQEIYKRCPVEKGDVLYIKDGVTTGLAAVNTLDEPFSMLSSVALLKPRRDVLAPQFLKHWLNSPETFASMTSQMTGSAIKRLILKQIRAASIPLPPLAEQKQIADKLDQLLAAVDACKARLDAIPAILKRFRQSVLAAAVSGKLTEEWRGTKSEVGKLPSSWVETRVREVGTVQLGRQRSPKYHSGKNVRPYLRVQNVFEDRLDLSDVMTMDFPGSDFDRYRLKAGDILLNEGQSPEYLGRPAMYRGEIEGACFTNTLIRFQASDRVRPAFALLVFRHHMHSGRYVSEGTITTNIAHLGVGRFGNVEFPLPPIDEQDEILRRTERLFYLAEQLEARFHVANTGVERVTESLLSRAFRGRLVKPDTTSSISTAVPDTPVSKQTRHFARAVLSAEIVHRLHAEPTFGRIKHQKIFHLCEHIVQLREVEGQYHREAAGPLDNKLIYANVSELKKQQWYEEFSRQKAGHAYRPLAKAGQHRKYAEAYWSDKLIEVEKLIELMRTWSTERCEIFSTCYAAWNDLIIAGEQISDDIIIGEILQNWHPAKARIPRQRWQAALQWMRQQNLVPTGFGYSTKKESKI